LDIIPFYNHLHFNRNHGHRLGYSHTIVCNNKRYSNDYPTILDWFFNRPRLRIECEEKKEPNVFTPERGDTKYLRIRVKNKGRRSAENCRARLTVIEDERDSARYPSTDPKPLPWGRSLELNHLQEEANIHPFIGEELLHVAFSALWFCNEQLGIKYHRYAEISTLERLRRNDLREEDSFTIGDFIVEVIVTSEGAFTKGKLRIHVEENFHKIGIKKLSRFEVLKYKFKLYIARLKRSRSPFSTYLLLK
jgi:hypothetical protein